MHRDAILEFYVWTLGTCFSCAVEGVSVTRLGAVETPIGDRYELYACEQCILAMERQRARRAHRLGFPYVPGGLGHVEQGESREQGGAGEPQAPQ